MLVQALKNVKANIGIAIIAGIASLYSVGLQSIQSAHGEDARLSSVISDQELASAFTNALQKISDERTTNRANEFSCTHYFSEFYRSKQIGRYIEYFKSRGISAIVVDQNQQHFVYFEYGDKQLRALGYRGFRRGDRVVIVFTTASVNSDEITSFSARLFGPTYP